MAGRKQAYSLLREKGHEDVHGGPIAHGEAELFRLLGAVRAPLLLVLDCVQDPHNLGACLRTADAAGVQAVIVPTRRSAPMTETVRRIACGGAESVPFVQVTNLARVLRRLKEEGVRVVGADHRARVSLFEEDLTGSLTLVIGGEDSGLRRLTAETCDSLVSIPMVGIVPCLNVSVAAGICLFEAVRQRLGVNRAR